MYPRALRNHHMITRGLTREFEAIPGDHVLSPAGLIEEIKDICELELAAYRQSVREELPVAKVHNQMLEMLEAIGNNPSVGMDPRVFFTDGQFIFAHPCRTTTLQCSRKPKLISPSPGPTYKQTFTGCSWRYRPRKARHGTERCSRCRTRSTLCMGWTTCSASTAMNHMRRVARPAGSQSLTGTSGSAKSWTASTKRCALRSRRMMRTTY